MGYIEKVRQRSKKVAVAVGHVHFTLLFISPLVWQGIGT